MKNKPYKTINENHDITARLKVAIAYQLYKDEDIGLRQFEKIKELIEEERDADIT